MTLVAHVQLCKAAGEDGDKLRLQSWIEIQLVGEDDQPIPNEEYALALPGGTIVKGKLDDQGTARVENLPSGVCKVSFPALDKEAWTTVETQSQSQSPSGETAAA